MLYILSGMCISISKLNTEHIIGKVNNIYILFCCNLFSFFFSRRIKVCGLQSTDAHCIKIFMSYKGIQHNIKYNINDFDLY